MPSYTREQRRKAVEECGGVDHALKCTGEEEGGSNATREEGGRPELILVAGAQRGPREVELRDSVDEESREKSRNLEYFRTAFFLKLSGFESLVQESPQAVSCTKRREEPLIRRGNLTKHNRKSPALAA